jgi:hypothetical protein
MVVVGIRNTQSQLGHLLVLDFTGKGNFWYWIAALFIVGAIGYIDELQAPSRMMLALIIVALIFSNKGFFQSFVSQLQQGSAQAPPPGPPIPFSAQGGAAAGAAVGGGVGSGGFGGLNPVSVVTTALPAVLSAVPV